MFWRKKNEKRLLRQMIDSFEKLDEPLIMTWVLYNLKWYGTKADYYRLCSRFQTGLSLGAPILATFGATYGHIRFIKPAVFIFSAIVTIAIGIFCSMHCVEQWVRYRTVCEKLRGLTIDFLYQCKDKEGTDIREFALAFLEKINVLIGKELEEWSKFQLNELQKKLESAPHQSQSASM